MLGISGNLIFDIVVDLSEIPHKEDIKERWRQRQESQAKAAPLPIQIAMAAKAGLVDVSVAQYAVDQMINQINKILEMQKICAEIHTPLKEAIHDHQWYHYNSEGRRAFDALGLVEHDIYLFSYYISLISEKVWKLYYEENPEEIPAKLRYRKL